MRHQQEDIETWSREGAALVPDFFTKEEMSACYAEMQSLYDDKANPKANAFATSKGFNLKQFSHIDNMPFKDAPNLTMLGLHPDLIAFARAALGTDEIYLYQSHSWAKYAGETNFEQPFHCDYKNHTLLVPSEDTTERTINCMIYITDVGEGNGAISYVPQSVSDPITGPNRQAFESHDSDIHRALAAKEQRGVGSSGSIFAYGIDVYHRGMNLIAPNGFRYTLTASFKAASNNMVGYTAWPFHFMQPWSDVFDRATPDQLACLGVPRPGEPFWTPRTIERAQERYPNWDMTTYRAAL